MYILMGTEPLLSPFTVRFKHTPYPTFNRVRVQAAIEIETPDITDVQWRAIHQEIRQAWGVENTTLLDEDDQRLQNIVIQLGGVPRGAGNGFLGTSPSGVEQTRTPKGRAEAATGLHI